MYLGIDLLTAEPRILRGKRLGVVAHQASLTSSGQTTLDALAPLGTVTALFGPEHGVETLAQDMEGVRHAQHPTLGVPVFSLYGTNFDSLKPTKEMCDLIDTFVIDLQDIGSRYYTYIYTMMFCMQAAKRYGKSVIVCDRPNPINGLDVEGRLIDDGFHSFVGMAKLPVRHGMTIGELAQFFNAEIGCDLTVIPMQGWRREMDWEGTRLPWTNPSPNMRSLHAALLYPGMCLLEGTNVSEGRGTDSPFDICGAPWIIGEVLAKKMQFLNLPGISFSPTVFTPTFQKYAGERCEGVRLTITDRKSFHPYKTGLALLWTLSSIHVATENPREFKWRTECYEFVDNIPAIDLLTGNSDVRTAIDQQMPWLILNQFAGPTPADFLTLRQRHLLY